MKYIYEVYIQEPNVYLWAEETTFGAHDPAGGAGCGSGACSRICCTEYLRFCVFGFGVMLVLYVCFCVGVLSPCWGMVFADHLFDLEFATNSVPLNICLSL